MLTAREPRKLVSGYVILGADAGQVEKLVDKGQAALDAKLLGGRDPGRIVKRSERDRYPVILQHAIGERRAAIAAETTLGRLR